MENETDNNPEITTKESTSDSFEHKIHLNGISGFVLSVKENGHKITISGWDNRHWTFDKGQRVLLVRKDGKETRYKFDSITHCGDPSDQYFADCSFHPRL